MGPSDASGVRSLGWMAQGACRSADPELFFPIAVGRASVAQVKAAKAICRGCAVRESCLSYGLATRQEGIWGGATLDERITMWRRASSHSAAALASVR
jgi:WhiB family redox-sensing transcriptional regulator